MEEREVEEGGVERDIGERGGREREEGEEERGKGENIKLGCA